jgi:hypothetical protein
LLVFQKAHGANRADCGSGWRRQVRRMVFEVATRKKREILYSRKGQNIL